MLNLPTTLFRWVIKKSIYWFTEFNCFQIISSLLYRRRDIQMARNSELAVFLPDATSHFQQWHNDIVYQHCLPRKIFADVWKRAGDGKVHRLLDASKWRYTGGYDKWLKQSLKANHFGITFIRVIYSLLARSVRLTLPSGPS